MGKSALASKNASRRGKYSCTYDLHVQIARDDVHAHLFRTKDDVTRPVTKPRVPTPTQEIQFQIRQKSRI